MPPRRKRPLLHRKQCNTQYIKGTGGKHTHIYTRTSKLVTDATPPPWLQSTAMLTSIISSYLSSYVSFMSAFAILFIQYALHGLLIHTVCKCTPLPLLSGPPSFECPVHYTEIYEVLFLLHQAWILNVKT